MSPHRLTAFLLVALEAAVAGYEFGRPIFAVAVPLFALVGASGRAPIRAAGESRKGLAFLLGVAVVALWLATPPSEAPVMLLRYGIGYAAAQYFILLQLVHLFAPAQGPIPPIFVLYGGLAMAATGDIQVDGSPRSVFHSASLAFAVLFAAFAATSQARLPAPGPRRRTGLLLATLMSVAAMLSTARAGSWVLSTYQSALNEAFDRLAGSRVRMPSLGFSDKAVLGNMAHLKMRNADATALRVRASAPPGYLRAKTFDELSGVRWSSSVEKTTLAPLPASARPPFGDAAPHLYALAPGPAAVGPTERIEVFTDVDSAGLLFTPLDTRLVALGAPGAEVGPDGTVSAADGATPSFYGAVRGGPAANPPAPSPESRRILLRVPGKLDPRIRGLARRLFAGRQTTEEKVAAVVEHFERGYRYGLSIQVPRGKDALAYFILERPAAHCEYFASAAAILLRLGGVPCRYVTGYVAADYNPLGGYWNVRNRDAHAWVEAFDDAGGWLTVEATVAEGVPAPPQPAMSTTLRHFWDWVKDLSGRVRAALNARTILRALGSALATARGKAGALLLAAGVFGLIWLLRRGRRARRERKGPRSTAPELAQMQRLLRQVDRRLRAAGFTRAPSETLHHFAGRLRDAADEQPEAGHAPLLQGAAKWYSEYAMLRYSGAPCAEEVSALAAARPGRQAAGSR